MQKKFAYVLRLMGPEDASEEELRDVSEIDLESSVQQINDALPEGWYAKLDQLDLTEE